MSIERSIDFIPPAETVPSQEVLTPNDLKWFSGALEIGGSMSFSITRITRPNTGTTYVRSNPFIYIAEADEQLSAYLRSRFGGEVRPTRGTFYWRLYGHAAANLMAAMEPFAVTRVETSTAAQNWLQAESTEEKVAIAEELRRYDRRSLTSSADPSPEQEQFMERYRELVNEPAFLAGIIDHRGTIRRRGTGHSTSLEVVVNSGNTLLLDSLQQVYGGSTTTLQRRGDSRIIQGSDVTLKYDHARWTIATAQARRVVEVALGHLKVLPYEGWNVRFVDEQTTHIQGEINSLEAIFREELEAFKTGKIERLSNLTELSEATGLSHATLLSRIRALPDDIRKERSTLAKKWSKRILTPGEAKAIQDMITEEVQEYIAGNRMDLMTNNGLAALFSVDRQVIKRHVVKYPIL